ncbi:conserved hypothetical protein [Dehalogenimonas lykanthroporepellens BL-DC-9]|jgi:hypothetical protein|nr:conserved hypothetical protein [Dehalogenimonas lykanthroporepellens BL-DC-9]
MDPKERIRFATAHTHVIRPPTQLLETFGQTQIHYYLLTEPSYSEINETTFPETVLREGKVIAEQPKLVTPQYMRRLEGFGDEVRRYFDMIASSLGANSPGLLYTYRNEPGDLNILSGNLPSVAERINNDIIRKDDKKAAIIRGVDELWDVSLFKFIYELTEKSVKRNISELEQQGLLAVDASGVTVESRVRLERMFIQLAEGAISPASVKLELDRWSLFDEYQDRFFAALKSNDKLRGGYENISR